MNIVKLASQLFKLMELWIRKLAHISCSKFESQTSQVILFSSQDLNNKAKRQFLFSIDKYISVGNNGFLDYSVNKYGFHQSLCDALAKFSKLKVYDYNCESNIFAKLSKLKKIIIVCAYNFFAKFSRVQHNQFSELIQF